MILCAGLTPAWQQILVFDGFRYGQVNRASKAVWCSSGKVLNAGIAAHHLGSPSLTLAPIGGVAAEQIEAEFASLGVPGRWIRTAAETRVCTTILDRKTGTMTELVENGRPVTADELHAFCLAYEAEVARAEMVVLIGSLPEGTPGSLYRELLSVTACPAVLDFRREGLLSVLDLNPYVVKPNREELELTVGRRLDGDEKLLQAMRHLNSLGARWAVVTDGPRAVWITSEQEIYRLQPPAIENVVNPIASGDTLAATVAWATCQGRSMVDAVRLGIAAAAQNVQQLLPARIDPTRLEAEAANVSIERL